VAFKQLFAALQPKKPQEHGGAVEFPLETEAAINRLHGSAPLNEHLEILFRDVRIGSENFTELYRRCLADTGTPVTPFNVFHRFQSRRDLLQYFFATLALPGARAECGTYRGATALLLAHAWRSREPAFTGNGLYLIDSFIGTSESGQHDFIPVRDEDGATRREAFFPVAKAGISPELVRGYFSEFPGVSICPGWIPQVFATLPELNWAFVHLDVTLYEPTLAALRYFVPRLTCGGVIICDGSIFCPGAKKAWDEYCATQDLPFIVLGNRETILIKR
jgi:hypothetical protein